MARIGEIWRYPVKSMGGERLSSCRINETGLEGDRRWAFVDGQPNRAGKLLTIRQDERLMTYRARLSNHLPEVETPAGATRRLDDRFVADLSVETSRPLTLHDGEGLHYDDSHVLVVNKATVAAFELSVGMDVDRRRFRANLYVDDLEPDEELRWLGRRIQAGGAELEVTSRCERCVVITRDPDTAAASPELLRVLTETSDTCMGVYCTVIRPGTVTVGDPCGLLS